MERIKALEAEFKLGLKPILIMLIHGDGRWEILRDVDRTSRVAKRRSG
jgi:hypothetical protein